MPPIELNERMNEVPSLADRALILVCSYRGADRSVPSGPATGALGRLGEALTLRGLRQFIAQWRDFYANPRSASYQLQMVQALAARFPAGADVILDTRLEQVELAGISPSFGDVSRRDLGAVNATELPAAPSVILVYADPLGLTWGRLEKGLCRQGRCVIVVNGRRRMFLLNDSARRALRLRRFLANTRLVELLGGALLIPLSGMLALKDRLAGRT